MTTDDLRTRAEAVAKRVWPDRPDADRITYPHAALQHYRQGAFVQGALWHAAQQPTREQIARAMHADDLDHGREVWRWEDMSAKWHDRYRSNADVVLALLTGDESDE